MYDENKEKPSKIRRLAFLIWYIVLIVVIFALAYGFYGALTANECKAGAVVIMALFTAGSGAGAIASYKYLDERIDD